MSEQTKEHKGLAITAIVLGAVGIGLSWIPLLNLLGIFIAIIGIVFGVIALILNWRNTRRVMSIIGTLLSVLAIILTVIINDAYVSTTKHAVKSAASSIKSSSASEEKARTKWTQADVDGLTVGDTVTGAGGTNYDDIVSQFGEPDSKTESTIGNTTLRTTMWFNTNGGAGSSVGLTFEKQADGSWLLSSKSSAGLK
jgi:hypothetical protein